jgi:carboxyl-terminal processing protease
MHYEVGRRYADQSYLDSLRPMAPRQAAELYDEVLQKIQTHHVETPNWSTLFERGTAAVEVALNEPVFQQRYRLALTVEESSKVVQQARRLARQFPVQNRQQLRTLAQRTAQYVEQQTRGPQSALLLEYACAAVASLDDYSTYLTGSQYDEVMSQIEGNFVGLGIELKSEAQWLLIVNVIPGGPADRAGLMPGDRIVQVAGQSTSDIPLDTAADMLKGPEGSTIELVVVTSQGTTRSTRLARQVVEVPSVENIALADPTYGVGYMKLTSFQKTSGRDVDAALWKLHREGMRSLIIDVRGNPGGLLTSAVEIADKFIGEGSIVSTRGRGSGEDHDYKAHLIGTWRVPLVVMIDRNSASASEIFAAAVRDARRGTIVGERSFGKGSVQGIFPLSTGNAGLRITTAKFYSPNHQPISGHGVQPHVLVHSVARPVPGEKTFVPVGEADPFLEAALQVARQQAAQP